MFCVMNIQKRKRTDISGIQKEATRTATEYNNRVQPGMDIFNVNLIQSNNWMQDIQAEIDQAGAKTRSNSVVALDAVYTASGDFFKGKSNEENDQFFRDCLEFHQRKFGHVISAVIHYDETTPHLHILSVPLTQDGRLSAREIIGNRANLSRMQTEFFEQVGKEHGLERGIHMDGQEKRQHISAQEHELRELKQKIARGQEELEAIEHSKESARSRAQKARQTATELQKQVEQLQAERVEQHNSLKMLSASKLNMKKELRALDDTLQEKKDEFEAIRKDVETVKVFLSEAQQNRLAEIEREWNDAERE
jgi:DNA repair exonuclease SbcCD ATPase subunit